MPAKPTLILAAGHSQIGSLLLPFLARHFDVTILSRHPQPTPLAATLPWDGQTLGPWAASLDGAAALINLAGRSVNCRYTKRNRRAMMDSRIHSTRILGQAIAGCNDPPPVWLNASTATIYKHSYDTPMDEHTGTLSPTPEAKDAFSLEIATRWEQTLFDAPAPRTRKIALRTAIVLANHPDNMLTILRRLVRLGLGGRASHGRQKVSWIHAADFARAVLFLLRTPALAGPVNLAAPNPLTNAEMMHTLRRHFHTPLGLPAPPLPRPLLELGAFFHRTETELLLKSRYVMPTRLLEAGFTFDFPHFQPALENLFPARPRASTEVVPTPSPAHGHGP